MQLAYLLTHKTFWPSMDIRTDRWTNTHSDLHRWGSLRLATIVLHVDVSLFHYRRSGNFHGKNICVLNFALKYFAARRFCNIALIRVFYFRALNFCCLSNWRKNFNGEDFPIYGISFTFFSQLLCM